MSANSKGCAGHLCEPLLVACVISSLFSYVGSFFIPAQKHMLWELVSHLSEALLMNTHDIYFHGEIRKLSVFFFRKCLLLSALGPVVQTNDVIS